MTRVRGAVSVGGAVGMVTGCGPGVASSRWEKRPDRGGPAGSRFVIPPLGPLTGVVATAGGVYGNADAVPAQTSNGSPTASN